MNCAFCSQSRFHATNIKSHPLLSQEQLAERCTQLASLPVQHIGIVTSGAALNGEEFHTLCNTIQMLAPSIRERLCVSLGTLSDQNLHKLSTIGIRRFHHNLESSSQFYPKICQTQTWQMRKQTVLRARAQGLENCTGGLFGLGESFFERIRFAFQLKALHISHIPLNFLHPHPHTPLGKNKPLSPEEALRCIAIFRHILPTATLRVCGGRPITFGTQQNLIFKAGANALMVGDYLTTQGSGLEDDLRMIATLGFMIDR